jgi:hypothetical protein
MLGAAPAAAAAAAASADCVCIPPRLSCPPPAERQVALGATTPSDAPRRGAPPRPRMLVYVLCHDDASEARARRDWPQPWARPLRTPTSARVECGGILAAAARSAEDGWDGLDYVGFLQYSAADPQKDAPVRMTAAADAVQRGIADVVALSRWCGAPHPHGDPHTVHHVALAVVWEETLLPALGFARGAPPPCFRTFFHNHWLARPPLVRAYALWLKHVALPALETDPRVFQGAWDRAAEPATKPVAPALAALGFADWPLLCYVQERLAGFYFAHVLPPLLPRPLRVLDPE